MAAVSGCGWAEWPPKPVSFPKYGGKAPENKGSRSNERARPSTIKVATGDTVYNVARRHGVSVRALIDANRLRPPYRLRAGQILALPRSPVHVVKSGDTLYAIALRYGVGMYSLARTNGLQAPYLIRVGQSLKIPGWSRSIAAKARPRRSSDVPKKPRPRGTSKQSNSAPPPVPQPVMPLPPPKARSSSGFLWPVRGRVVSRFGAKAKGLHNDGINIATRRGVPVLAADHGVVAYAGNELRGFGNLLLIKHSEGWVTAYAHNQVLLVKRGQSIKKGQSIARVGSTGTVNTPQLHFELRKGKRAVDPQKYLSRLRI
ncbi:MAG: LysM peptidoglycan-binding domain-containing M23 family metallopeptidase [Rhodospirillales bacterium]|nr:LysM peptidoglycan-binding domain-containing M23 family metallopeptidase [Rhodospirillales bacterium]